MIQYTGIEKRYKYDKDKIQPIREKIEANHYSEFSSQEEIGELISDVESFLETFEPEEVEKTMERHETEEEARDYFGPEFIKEWNDLLIDLDKQHTIVSLHGTPNINGPSICETGLNYKASTLSATAVSQTMPYGDDNFDFPHFESLLNWGHHQFKCLVIIAVPYECYYKEGLWTIKNSNNSGYDYNHTIDPDFIVGYIDVENKKIVRNPKYNRNHDYTGKDKDQDLFHEQKDMDNDKIANLLREQRKELSEAEKKESTPTPEYFSEKEMEPREIPYTVENLLCEVASLYNSRVDYIPAEDKQGKLDNIVRLMEQLKRIFPKLKTKEELEQIAKASDVFGGFADFSQTGATLETTPTEIPDFDFPSDFIWPDDVWEDKEENSKGLH